jgi:HK97 family phage major capsid protein
LTPAAPSALGGSVYGLDREEHRLLSKASSAAGGYLVPTSLDERITAARRARTAISAISREVVTSDGTQMLFPSGLLDAFDAQKPSDVGVGTR